MSFGKSGTVGKAGEVRVTWPRAAKVAVTLALLFHVTAIWAGLWGAGSPASPLQRRLAGGFRWYYGLIDQGYTYRYYANPGPTPVVTAVIHYPDGRIEEVRLPDRKTRPRMLYQRELALANHLWSDVEEARHEAGDPSASAWAQSYARHLGKTHPGARSVTLSVQMHEIPDPRRVAEALEQTGKALDLDDPDQFYTVPERIGEFPCAAS
jgi:hypothetical protein